MDKFFIKKDAKKIMEEIHYKPKKKEDDEVEKNAAERVKLTKALEDMGCKVYESQTNFILFKAPKLENTEIYAKLAEQKVLIGAPVGMNRVSIGTAEMNDKFIKIMQEILK